MITVWLKRALTCYIIVALLYLAALVALHRYQIGRAGFGRYAVGIFETAAIWPYVLVRDGHVRRL